MPREAARSGWALDPTRGVDHHVGSATPNCPEKRPRPDVIRPFWSPNAITRMTSMPKGVSLIAAPPRKYSFAVQIARALGASVTGVASAQKLDLVRELGATRTIDYAAEDFADGSATYDLIVDIGGNSPLRRLRRALTRTGTLVIVGGEGGGQLLGGTDRQLRAVALSPLVGQRLTTFVAKEDQGLDDLAALIEAGSVVPALERAFPLEQAADALRHLEAGDVRGKIAIRVRAS